MKLEQSQETLLLNICELNARIEAHEVQCEERTKTIFNRLEAIEENTTDFNFTYGQFALWVLILFVLFGGVLYYVFSL